MAWLRPVVKQFPASNPSQYLLGDALVILNESVKFGLFPTKPGIADEQKAINMEAIEMASDFKRLVSKLRKIEKPNAKGSHDPDIAQLKNLLEKQPKYCTGRSSSSTSSSSPSAIADTEGLSLFQEDCELETMPGQCSAESSATGSLPPSRCQSQIIGALSQLSSTTLSCLCDALKQFMDPENRESFVCKSPEGSQPVFWRARG